MRNSPKPHGDPLELHHNHRVSQPHDMQDHLQICRQATHAMQEQHRRVRAAQPLAQGTLQRVGCASQHDAGVHAEPLHQPCRLC